MAYIVEHEGPLGLFKGIGPQILKGLLVQGILMMTKERMELVFMMLFAYAKLMRQRKLAALEKKLREQAVPVAEKVASGIKDAMPLTTK
jgi:Mitochondrial carrier protein